MPTYNQSISKADIAARIPEVVSPEMLTTLEAESAAVALGRKINVPTSQIRFPVVSALPSAEWIDGETGLKPTTKMAYDNAYLNISELATIVPISEEALEDSGFDIEAAVKPLMMQAVARKLDAAVFFGVDKPTIQPAGLVPAAVAAGNVVARGTNNAAAGGLYGDLSDTLGKLELDGYFATGAIAATAIKGRLRQTRATDGQKLDAFSELPEFTYPLRGDWPQGLSAAEVIVGDFSNLFIGIRKDMTFKVLTESTLFNADGTVQFALAQQDMFAIRLKFRVGWAVNNPLNYDNADAASRYPFAVLRSPAS